MPLPAIAAPIIAQGAVSLAQTIGGLIGGRRARDEFEEAEAPNYLDSQAYQTQEALANQSYRFAQEGLPEASRRFQEDMIGRSGAAALATTGSLRSGIAGVGQTAQSLADSYRTLAMDDANQRIANRGEYFRQMGRLQQEQRVQADREYGQFLNQQAARLSLMTGNRQTMNMGIQGLSQAGTLAFDAFTIPEMYGGLMKGAQTTPLNASQASSGGMGSFGTGIAFQTLASLLPK